MGQNPKEGQGIMENSQNFTPNNDVTNSQTTVGAGGGVVSGVRDKNNDLNELIDEFKSLESDKADAPSNETKSEDENTKEISETLSDMSFDEPETTSVIKEGEKYTLSQEENDQIEKYLLGADEDDDDVVEYVEDDDEEESQSDHSADDQEEVEEEVEEEVVDEDEDEPVIIEDDFDEDEDSYDDYNTKDEDDYDDYDDEETADEDYDDTYDDSDEDLENDEYADEDLEEDDNYDDEYDEAADEEDDVVADDEGDVTADDEGDVAVDEENDADETADEDVAEAEDTEELESEDETLQQEDAEENKEVEASDKESEQPATVGKQPQEQVTDLGQGVVQEQEPVQNVQSQSVESVEQQPTKAETQAEVVAEYQQPQQMQQPVQQPVQQTEQQPVQQPQVTQQVPVQPVQYVETPQVAQQPQQVQQPVQQSVQQAEQQPQVVQQVPVQPVQYAETLQVAQQPQQVQQPVQQPVPQQVEQPSQVAQQTYITPQAVEPTPQTVAQPVLQSQPADSYVEKQTTNANGNNLATNEEPVRYFASVSNNTESARNDVQRVVIPLGVDTAEKEENRPNGAYIQIDAQKGFPAEQQSEPEYEDSEYTYINTENKPSKDDEVEFEDAEYVFKNNDKNEGQVTQEPEYENTEYVFKNISVNMSPVQDEPEYEDSEYTYTNTEESVEDNQLNNELPQAGEVKTESEPVLTNEQELAGNSVEKESGINERSAEMKALEDRLFARIMSTLTEMKITPGEAREAISNATNTIVLPEEEVKLDLSKFNGKVETFVPLESIPQATWEDVVKRKGHHTYHVTCASNGGYFIKKAKTASPYAFVELKDEALEVAKAYAKREKAELKIHDAKGVIEQSMSFGKEKKKSNKK